MSTIILNLSVIYIIPGGNYGEGGRSSQQAIIGWGGGRSPRRQLLAQGQVSWLVISSHGAGCRPDLLVKPSGSNFVLASHHYVFLSLFIFICVSPFILFTNASALDNVELQYGGHIYSARVSRVISNMVATSTVPECALVRVPESVRVAWSKTCTVCSCVSRNVWNSSTVRLRGARHALCVAVS